MEESTIWGGILAVIIVTLVLTIGGCTVSQSNTIAEMVKNGADPMKAACAVRGNGAEPWCVIAAQK